MHTNYAGRMDQKPNNKQKRIRKRIALKTNSSDSKDENKVFQRNQVDNDRPVPLFFSRINDDYKDRRTGNNNRSGNSNPFQNKHSGNSNNRFSKRKDFQDPKTEHKIFKKHKESAAQNHKVVHNQPSKKQDEPIRLNKYISNSGVCSRREADELIAKGLIEVNGKKIVEMGYKVSRYDTVTYKGKIINEASHVYILLNKPKDTITTTSDPENRLTVMDLVQKATEKRIFPIGRLDRNTTGILLLTNDGDFAQKLSHPSSELRKVYYAVLDKPLNEEDFDKIAEGVELDDGLMKVDELAFVDPGDKACLGIEIHSGKNRVIHRIFEKVGYKVKKLDRVVYAGLDKGGLRRGKWRFLRYDEVQTVLNSIKYVHD